MEGMEMREPFKNFYRIFRKREKITEYRNEGRKILGLLCNNIPEEIIHALGAVPVRLIGFYETTALANSKAPSWMCMYSRGVLEGALRGDFDFVDGIVSATTDDTKIQLFSSYKFYIKPSLAYLIQFPYVKDSLSREFFEKELERFVSILSKGLSAELSDEKLKNSIEIYNDYRKVCLELEKLRKEDSPKISSVEWFALILSSLAMLKDDFVKMVKEELERLTDFEGRNDFKIRIHLSGTDFYHLEILKILEECGMAVVSDDLCTSAGYYTGFVEGKDLRAVAKRYSECSACVMTLSHSGLSIEERLRFIKEKVRESKADAIVVLKDRGCEVCGHQCPWIVREADVPVLVLDLDFPVSVEQYRTRIEAFVEAHGGG